MKLKIRGQFFKYLVGFTLIFSIYIMRSGLGYCQSDTFETDEKFFKKYMLANKHFNKKCKKYLIRNNFSKAEKELIKCLEIMPVHVNSYFFLSQILYQQGKFEEALVNIQKAKANYKLLAKRIRTQQTLDSKRVRDRSNLLRETMDHYQEYMNKDGACNIAPILQQSRDELNTLNTKNTNSNVVLERIPAEHHYLHGNILFKLKQLMVAEQQYKNAINSDPKHERAYNNLANLLYLQKNFQNALDYLKEAEKNGVKVNLKLKQAILLSIKE
jgi:tetratricopeptide (TPR) repeat protein